MRQLLEYSWRVFLWLTLLLSTVYCDKKKETSSTPQCQSNPAPVFTSAIVDPNNILVVIPPGLLTSAEPKGHSYIRSNVPSAQSPVYAPVDMTLKSILYYDSYASHGGNPTYKIYKLEFDISCEVSIWLDHVYQPVSKISSVGATVPASNTGSQHEVAVNITFVAGELIGYSQPFEFDELKSQVDFGVRSSQSGNTFVSPSKFPVKMKDSVCPYDFFTSGLKEQYKALYGDETPVAGGICRSAAMDIANTISGFWFSNSNTGSGQGLFQGYLGIGLNVNQDEFQVGGLRSGSFSASFGASAKPANVGVGQEVCYSDSTSSHVFFRLNGASSLDVAYRDDSDVCPGGFPASPGYSIYETYSR